MEKYTTIKVEEIRRLAESKQYQEAITILDSVDIRKVKAIPDLSVFAAVLSKNERYEEAVEILLRIYEKSKTRRILSQLIYLTLKLKKYDAAEGYYDEYLELAPNDDSRFVLHYRIEKAKGTSCDELIDILEELKEHNYIEEWAYELAKLYHKAGYKDKCIEECNDIILWFGEGAVVEKANTLKEYYTGAEKDNLDSNFAEEETKKEDEEESENWKEIIVDYSGLGIRGIEKFQEPSEETDCSEEDSTKEADRIEAEKEEDMSEFDLGEDGQIMIQDIDMDAIFKNYLSIASVSEQLEVIFRKFFLNQEDKQENFYISGYGQSGKTRLAIMISKACYKLGKIMTPKVALITAEKLNHMGDVRKREKSLKDCCVVIEEAGELEDKTIAGLLDLMKQLENHIIVILEDSRSGLESCFEKHKDWKEKFDLSIHLPDYNKEDLIGFMKRYLKDTQYELDEDADEILKNVAGSIARRIMPDKRLGMMCERLEKAKASLEKREVRKDLKLIQAEDFRIG